MTGEAAGSADFTDRLDDRDADRHRASCSASRSLLLVAAFRSPALAAAVIALNLLSVGAAYGILAAVFQHEWAEGLLDFTSTGTVVRLAAAVRVRDPVRALDGLHDPRARADPRGAPRRAPGPRGRGRGRRGHGAARSRVPRS